MEVLHSSCRQWRAVYWVPVRQRCSSGLADGKGLQSLLQAMRLQSSLVPVTSHQWQSQVVKYRPPDRKVLPPPFREHWPDSLAPFRVLLGRAEAERSMRSQLGDTSETVFGPRELARAFSYVSELASGQFRKEFLNSRGAWHLLAHHLIAGNGSSYTWSSHKGEAVVLAAAAKALQTIGDSQLGISRHGVSLPLARTIVRSALAKVDRLPMPHLASTVASISRMNLALRGDLQLTSEIEALVQSAAEQLPYRIDAGEPAIGGEAVGNLCEALVQMKMLGEEFTGLVCGMLRTDWDRMWSAQALGQAAEYLERARCRDSRAWRALLHRATMELPGIDQGDLARLLNACTAAGIRSERFMSILVDHLLEDDWHLTAEMTACLCRMLASPREVGEDLWKNVLVLDRLLRAIPRHASALAVGDLWPAMATSLKVVDTTSTLGGLHSLASSSLRSLLVALRRYAHALRIEEAEALLPLFARAADAGVEDGDLYSSIVMQACQQSRRGAMDSLSQGNSMSLALAAVLLHVAQGRHALGSNHLALHSAVVSSLSDLTKQLPLSSSSPGERWLMVCRLLATYGFAQANSESTLRALLQQFEAALSGGLPKPEQLDGLAITLPGLAAMQFRLPGRIRTSVLACLAASARRRQKRRRSLTSTAPGMGSSILTSLPVALSLLELDGVHSPQDLKLLCDVLGDSQDQLSTQVLASLTLSMLSRLPWQAPCQQYDGDAPAGAWCQAAIDTLSRRLLGTQDDLSSTGLPPGFPNLSTTTDAIRMISMLLFASSSSTCQLGTIPLETARKLGELHRRGDFPANSSGSGRIEPLGDGSGTIASELLASLQHLFARKKVRTDYMVEVSSELKTPVTSCGDAEGMVLLPKCFADMFSIRIAVLQPRHFSRSQSPVAIRERSTLTIFHPRKQMKMVQ